MEPVEVRIESSGWKEAVDSVKRWVGDPRMVSAVQSVHSAIAHHRRESLTGQREAIQSSFEELYQAVESVRDLGSVLMNEQKDKFRD